MTARSASRKILQIEVFFFTGLKQQPSELALPPRHFLITFMMPFLLLNI